MENNKNNDIIFGMQAKMAAINEALQNDAIKEGAWLLLNFPPLAFGGKLSLLPSLLFMDNLYHPIFFKKMVDALR